MGYSSKQILALVKNRHFAGNTPTIHFLWVCYYMLLPTVFVVYLSAGRPEEQTWNALFWIVQLFVSINAVAKSFLQDSKGRMLYYYTISGPANYITAKIIFNALLMLVMSLLTLLVFTLLLGNPVIYFYKFLLISFLGGTGLSLVFTFLAAIAAKAQQQSALMAIMGFPIVIPQLLLLGKNFFQGFQRCGTDRLVADGIAAYLP
jgi:heme exporter protein B